MTGPVKIALVPRDGLFCKDGRGWHTSTSGRGHALEWPWPSTLLGAVRSAWGRAEEVRNGLCFTAKDWRERTAQVALGASFALRRRAGEAWTMTHRVWPAPQDALLVEGRPSVQRLDPLAPVLPTLGRDDDEAREALWQPRLEEAAKPLPGPRWWGEERMAAWLAGGEVPAEDRARAFDLSRRIQAHVGIDPERLTAGEGVLFSHDVIETSGREADGTMAEWAIGLEAALPPGDMPPLATLGSDSRLAPIETVDEHVFRPAPPVVEAFEGGSRGLRLVVVTPATFAAGWLPDGLVRRGDEYAGQIPGIEGEVILRAAFVSRPLHISGWDMAANNGRGAPKPASRMVAPGAVYFVERRDGRPFDANDARAAWLLALGERTAEGFGRVVPGVWHPNGRTK